MGILESTPPEIRDNFNKIWTSPKKRSTALTVLAVISLLIIYSTLGSDSALDYNHRYDVGSIQNTGWRSTSDYDLVISHYDEDINMMRDSIKGVKNRLPLLSSKRVIIYSKGPRDNDGLKELLEMSDEVVKIENVGREGETYLSHIVRHYDTPQTDFAKHTIFMQPHIAWKWEFWPRLEKHLTSNTGFMSFGPYISHTCGNDSHGQIHPRMSDIYSMFRMDLCPPEPVLGTWAGQFIVSRQRILENPLRAYVNLREKFHVPKDHWIYKEGWWNNEPSNPTLGHALERSWPMIFNCTDATKEKGCTPEGSGDDCQCLD